MICPAVLVGVVVVICFFVADTLPLSLFFGGWFAVIATWAGALSPTSLQSPPQCVMVPICGYFVASIALVASGGCFAAVLVDAHLFSVDVGNLCVDVFFL